MNPVITNVKTNNMKTEEDLMIFDDEKAVQFIKKLVPKELQEKLNEEVITYVLDIVYDYYQEKGLIDEEATVDATIDETEMFEYVFEASKKDNISIAPDEIKLILDGEYEYGKSLGIYFEDEE